MTMTMRAAVVHALGQPLTIEDVPVPTPGPGEVLVKLVASGVCHTDLHAAEGDWPVLASGAGRAVVVRVGPGAVGSGHWRNRQW